MWNKIKNIFSKQDQGTPIEYNEENVANSKTPPDTKEFIQSQVSENVIASNTLTDSQQEKTENFDIPENLYLAKSLLQIRKEVGMEIVQSPRISSALADYKAFANYRPAQTIFKTLVSDGIYKELIDVQISNPSNQISKYVTRISGTYGYQSALVERLICEILIGLGKCTYNEIELESIIPNEPSSLSEKLNNQEEPIDSSNAISLPDHQFPYRLPGTDVFQEEYVYIPDDDDLMRIKERIMWLLGGYGIVPFSIESYPGPRYSMFELMVDSKHLSKLIRNEKDILDALGNKGCRIINPLPNKFAIGLEIPNQNVNEIIPPYYLFKSKQYTDTDAILPLALGIDSRNECIVKDLSEINNLLICGGIQQGKTNLLHQIVVSLLLKVAHRNFKLAILSESYLEFQDFLSLPENYFIFHEGTSEIISDKPVAYSLFIGLTIEMEERRKLLKVANVKNIDEYNILFDDNRLNPTDGHHFLPHIICIVDEIHSFLEGDTWNEELTRMFDFSINSGIHFIFTTRYTNTSVLTPLIRTYMPDRVTFNIRATNESRLIIGNNDATRLLNIGDVLITFNGQTSRCQTAMFDSKNLTPIIEFIKRHNAYGGRYILPIAPQFDNESGQTDSCYPLPYPADPLLEEVARQVVMSGTASTSAVQRRYEIGYNRAGRILDQLESLGIVGPAYGGKPRAVLVDAMTLEDILTQV